MASKRVLLLIETSRAYGRECVLGVAAYLRSHEPWDVTHVERGIRDEVPELLRDRAIDGVIARIETHDVVEQILRYGVPIVDARGTIGVAGVPKVTTSSDSVAAAAAEHFRERGFKRFAFCGYPGVDFSDDRHDAFARACEGAGGGPILAFEGQAADGAGSLPDREERGEVQGQLLAAWLESLPKPIAVLACNDVRGRQVLHAAESAGVEVPTDVAVLGVDDDELLCELSNPPLSSVIADARGVGFRSAEVLSEMMSGGPAPEAMQLVPAKGVMTRRSTDVLAIDDLAVVAALREIRDRACRGLLASDVVDASGVSRATLARRFQAAVGHGVKHEIDRVRIARVKQLLSDTTYDMTQIAELAGYANASHLAVSFKRVTGQTLGQFRDLTGR